MCCSRTSRTISISGLRRLSFEKSTRQSTALQQDEILVAGLVLENRDGEQPIRWWLGAFVGFQRDKQTHDRCHRGRGTAVI